MAVAEIEVQGSTLAALVDAANGKFDEFFGGRGRWDALDWTARPVAEALGGGATLWEGRFSARPRVAVVERAEAERPLTLTAAPDADSLLDRSGFFVPGAS